MQRRWWYRYRNMGNNEGHAIYSCFCPLWHNFKSVYHIIIVKSRQWWYRTMGNSDGHATARKNTQFFVHHQIHHGRFAAALAVHSISEWSRSCVVVESIWSYQWYPADSCIYMYMILYITRNLGARWAPISSWWPSATLLALRACFVAQLQGGG